MYTTSLFIVTVSCLVWAAQCTLGPACFKTKPCSAFPNEDGRGSALQELSTMLKAQALRYPDARFNKTLACTQRPIPGKKMYSNACISYLNTNGTLDQIVGNLTSLIEKECTTCGSVTMKVNDRTYQFVVDVSESTFQWNGLMENCTQVSQPDDNQTGFLCPGNFTVPAGCNANDSSCKIGNYTWDRPTYTFPEDKVFPLNSTSYSRLINGFISGTASVSKSQIDQGINYTTFMSLDRRDPRKSANLTVPAQFGLNDTTILAALNFLGLQYNAASNSYRGQIHGVESFYYKLDLSVDS